MIVVDPKPTGLNVDVEIFVIGSGFPLMLIIAVEPDTLMVFAAPMKFNVVIPVPIVVPPD